LKNGKYHFIEAKIYELTEFSVAVMLARPIHASKAGQSIEKGRPSKRHLKVTSMRMEVRALFGRIGWRDDITNNFLF